ncbi:MAG: flippase-like domain-containing protein [Candidatus Hadarchaeum sp.]|uniref:flippase-like domain-containing protein n=1 Tax=Candidatus Hadarchaeum sp. TaxID=2883567 RepID=UPI003D0A1315
MEKRLAFFNRRSILIFILLCLMVVAAAFLILREDLSSMLLALYQASPSYLLLAVLAYLSGLLFWSLRWRVTLSASGHPIPVGSIYVVILGGIFINNITPFTYAGGDPIARAYILKKTQNVPYSSGFATILSEYIMDLPVYISLLIFGLLISLKQFELWYGVFVFLIWLSFLIGWSVFFFHVLSSGTGAKRIARITSKLAKIFHRKVKEAGLERSIRRFYRSSERIIRNRKTITIITILTVTIIALAITRQYLIFQAFGYTPTLPMLFFALTLPALVGMIPALPGGLGTVDATILSVFLLFGVPLQIAVSVTLIERAITLVFSTLIGAGAISYLGIRQGNARTLGAKRRR